ncbi:MAG: GNAT family N-acetyltransferase [Eubacterium sp.]|nr:GNAT family N-acetyltransferase [Eubacterium sp.]
MEYRKIIKLKDGRPCVIRNGEESDAQESLEVFILTHKETDNLLSVPEEIKFTAEEQAEYLKNKKESDREVELVAVVDGKIVALGGIDAVHNRVKTRHRADFGVSVIKEYWGLSIGRALLEACVELAKKAGYEQLELDVVANNDGATALYESVGFTEYGRNPRGFKSPKSGYQELVQMRLELK